MTGSLPHFVCPECGRVSAHPEDLRNCYCGACHRFFTLDQVREAIRARQRYLEREHERIRPFL